MTNDDEPSRELATVTRLPLPDDTVEAEVVTAEEWAAAQQRMAAQARLQGYRRDVVAVTRVTRTAVTHQVTVTAARHALYVPAGAWVLARRVWEAKTNSRYERMMRGAETGGDWDRLEEWEQRAEHARERRHKRRMDWLKAPLELVRALATAVVTAVALLLLLGMVIAWGTQDPAQVVAPLQAMVRLIVWVSWAVAIVWGPLILALPWLLVLTCWYVGKRAGVTPGWLRTSADDDTDITIDETTVARALAALRIPQVTAYLKEGTPLQFLTPCRVDGRGTHCVIRLPAGVTADKIARRRADLATGLHRLAKEVWPTTGAEAGIVDLWIADKGALAEGAGPYPLLTEGAVDVFKGVPFGKHLRGTPITAPLLERNTLAGGIPGQGKSSAARCVMAGAALDATAELRIWVPDANFDFEAFRPRCSRYVMGAEDERIADIRRDLRDLHGEVQSRGELLVRYETPAVTREMANRDIGLHPLFCLLEEAHVAFGHPDYGQEIAKLVVDIVRLGRKRGIHMMVSTQAPTRDSMPRDVTRNCSNGIAFAVGDHVANDALLGQGAYSAGHRATELIPGADRGTAVVKGFTGERSEIVQVYFISIDREHPSGDQITPIIARSLDLVARRGKGVPGAGRRRAEAEPEARDLLDDVYELMGDAAKVRASEMAVLLRRAAPGWAPYAGLDGTRLVELLAAEAVEVRRDGGFPMIRADRVLRALDERRRGG